MDSTVPPPLPPSRAGRSRFVTALGWIMIVLGCLGLPITFISLLMVMMHSYGTSNADPIGILTVGFGPAAVAVSGVGLLRRKPWGWTGALVLLSLMLASNLWGIAHSLTGPSHYTSPEGVPTTVIPAGIYYYTYVVPFVIVCGVVIAKLLTPKMRAEFEKGKSASASPTPPLPSRTSAMSNEAVERNRGWRVGHRGRDRMFYEEWRDGAWQRIEVQGEMLMGRAHHAIYFATPQQWQSYPAWAQNRRDEIIARIKSEFRARDYEYQGDAPTE